MRGLKIDSVLKGGICSLIHASAKGSRRVRMELSSAKTSKLLGLAGAALALCLFAGCGPNKNVQDAQAAAQQADQSAQKADAASQSAQQAAASAQASASKTEQAAADAKAAADRAEAIAAKTETSSAPVRHYHRHSHVHHHAAAAAAPDTGSAPPSDTSAPATP
jgi:hypothetical protein